MIITVDRLRLYGHHGVMKQERTVGNDFEVSLTLDYPCTGRSDDLASTLNYAEAVEICKCAFVQPCNLLEHAARRMADALKQRWPELNSGTVTIAKLTPPIPGAALASVAVTLTF